MEAAGLPVVLEGDCTIRDAAGLQEALAAGLSNAPAGGGALRVETADLRSADIGILQVLVAAHRTARRLRRPLGIAVPPGGALERALAASGLLAGGIISLEAGVWAGLGEAEGTNP